MRGYYRIQNFLVLIPLLWACTASPLRAEEPDNVWPSQKAYLLWKQGYVLHLYGQYKEAIEYFSESINLHPTAEAYTYRGWSLSMLGRLQEAIAECKEAIRLDPDYGNPYNDIGVYLIDLDQPDAAIPWLKKAMNAKRYCCYQYPHFNLGRILLRKGRIAEAKRAFERALSYKPDYLPALMALELMRTHGLEPI